MQFYNQLSKRIDTFTPINESLVTLYTCGPTVYSTPTVGNWASYIHWDTLVRTLSAHGFDVKRVMNVTDVGHLVSDADDGEDKLEKGARREGKTAWEVAAFYTNEFVAGMAALNLVSPTHMPKATEFIDEQLALIRTLQNKGFTYQISDGIYYDTSKFPAYGDFAGLDVDAQKAGARVEFNPEKRNASDFALWKFTPEGTTRDMEWQTPADIAQGAPMGFPGWHLECSAMAITLLGETIDIHTGGIDHIPVHHTNEIAQSEAATDVQFAHYWLHTNHLKVNGTKISKSLGNGYTLDDLEERGFSPLDLRMAVLQGHYRSEGNFTLETLEAARNRRLHWVNGAALRHQIHATLDEHIDNTQFETSLRQTREAMRASLANDLNGPEALAAVDEALSHIEATPHNKIPLEAFKALLEDIDQLLGLQLLETSLDITDDQKMRIIERERAREDKDFGRSDVLRNELLKEGITLRDTPLGTLWEYTT